MENLTVRQNKLIQCFHSDEILTSVQLSKEMKISERTIRNEIKQINERYTNLILSIKGKGYQLNPSYESLDQMEEDQSEISRTRYLHIIKSILSQKETDYYDLADELYISETTLDKQLFSINQIIERRDPDMRIERKNHKLIINGDEEKRRQIYTYLMNHEMDQYNFNLSNYTNFFNSCDINELKSYFLEFTQQHHLELRDFEVISFILHIAIMLERVNKGNDIVNIAGYQPSEKADMLAHAFYDGLREKFDVILSKMELQYLSCLFAGKLSDMDANKVQEYRNFTFQIIDHIQQQYDIDLHEDQEFTENLLIHLLGLDSRIKTKSFLNNPLIKDIKLHFPLLYDMSVDIAMMIQKHYHTTLIEDEIGYLTLHIMSAVEKLHQSAYKRVVIINPLGNAASSYLKQKLMRCRELTIEISATYSIFDLEKIKDTAPDMVISFIPIPETLQIPVYLCHGFPKDEDMDRIIALLSHHGEKATAIDTQKFFHNSLFFPDMEVSSKEEAIHFLCEQLMLQGYCEEHYEEKVLAREKIAPTAYGNSFAIPHPIEKCAKQNAVAVGILKQPVWWNNRKIRLVFLFSLSSKRDPAFDTLFEQLVALLNDSGHVKQLIKEQNFHHFLSIFTGD